MLLKHRTGGAELILNACSSVGREGCHKTPFKDSYLKIDEPMARFAVEKGEKIAVYGTVKTTLSQVRGS